MSYLVFARKWRPQSFDDIAGQNHITRTLKLAIEKNRIAHAYIFSGTRGVGKTTTARVLARALNCVNGPTTEPCGKCSSCKSIINGSSLDVLEIDGASNNKVEDIRDLRDTLQYSSMGGRHRIYVIDEVHMLTKSAFNALLKSLEEPPENVVFIFATTEPHKIPDTIQSRCQRFDFRAISTEIIIKRMEHICGSESISYETEALSLIAQKADGSMRDALSLLDQAYSFCGEDITEKEVRNALGLVETEIYFRIMEACIQKNSSEIINIIDQVLSSGYDLYEFISGLQNHIRSLLFSRIKGITQSRGFNISSGDIESFTKQSDNYTEGDLLRINEVLRRTEQELKWSSFPRFLVETALLKIAFLDSTVSLKELLFELHNGSLDTAYNTGTPNPLIKKKDPPVNENFKNEHFPEPANSEDVSPENNAGAAQAENKSDKNVSFKNKNLAALWPEFIDSFINERPDLGTYLSLAYVASSNENSIDIRFSDNYSFQYSELVKKTNRNYILKSFTSFAEKPVEMHITKKTKKKKVEPKDSKPGGISGNSPPSLTDDMEKEPIIKQVIDIFSGEPL